ncbi:TBC1 domain family member 14 [Thecamonas trahens ATCC 50062]|uniref:TBC1 domain family member 14 n=1 Tax=Thecamonas trahens ATCC 50062 TaxID=461836 RepID=A0A0L0D6I7_THETB|nr:TBC1 domain family member 14 [Thecamonas trahens ATCC 50062]KNC47815.1 TBC1 domain family member 14 [Thecamonas trahens ATCC 50062]|eukprot:XP_013759293.1 TBC1 domain family member 14 [Thecamonas trahens ATCC 50062]
MGAEGTHDEAPATLTAQPLPTTPSRLAVGSGSDPDPDPYSPEVASARPESLPPKSRAEAARHAKLVRKMKKQAAAAEAKSRKAATRREDKLVSSKAAWMELIHGNGLGAGASKKQRKKVAELLRLGVPSSARPRVWAAALGNPLSITPDLFDILRSKASEAHSLARAARQSGAADGETSLAPREHSLLGIYLDLPRTYPELSIFDEGGPMHDQLRDVLGAFVCYRPDMGYVQGMSFPAALLLLNLPLYDAFVAFCTLLNMPLLAAFFRLETDELSRWMDEFNALAHEVLPDLAIHLDAVGLQPNLYLVPWVMTLFARALPLDLAAHAWDYLFIHGQVFIFHMALGILLYLRDQLLAEDFEGAMLLLSGRLPHDTSDADLFAAVRSIKLSPRLWLVLRRVSTCSTV